MMVVAIVNYHCLIEYSIEVEAIVEALNLLSIDRKMFINRLVLGLVSRQSVRRASICLSLVSVWHSRSLSVWHSRCLSVTRRRP